MGTLDFLYNGEKVPNLISTKIRLRNSGSIPIEANDFKSDFLISFPISSRIISMSILQTQPLHEFSTALQGTLHNVTINTLGFKPLLINPGEIFDIDILSTREMPLNSKDLAYKAEEIQTDFNIYGISKLRQVSSIKTNAERKIEANDSVKEILKITFLYLRAAIIVSVFVLILIFLSKRIIVYLPSFEIQNSILKKALPYIPGSILLFIFIYLIGPGLYDVIHNAYFLEI